MDAQYKAGFLAAVEMVRDKEDRYGIGSMCSQWTGEDIAEDMLERAGIDTNACDCKLFPGGVDSDGNFCRACK